MTETQERFLRAVLERVDAPRVAELHLFPAIRRGAVETGVAVIAVVPEAVTVIASGDASPATDTEPAVVALVPDAPTDVRDDARDDVRLDARHASATDVHTDDYANAPDLGMPVDGDALAIAAARAEPPDLDAPVDGDMLTIAAAEGVAPDVDAPVDGDALTIAAAAEGDAPMIVADVDAPAVGDGEERDARDIDSLLDDSPYAPDPTPTERVVVEPVVEVRARILTASYRLTIKGPERGTWTVDVQEQADAPLSAVEAVLRGVRQRSSDPADPENVPLALLQRLLHPVATGAALPVGLPVAVAASPVTPAVVADAA